MKRIQEKVKIFCEKNKLSSSLEHRVLDMISELGEFSKEILKANNYGEETIVLNNKLKMELGDVFFSLITIANSIDIDLDKSLNKVLKKYQKRLNTRLTPASSND